MKCELCHQKDAETAIQVERNGSEEELYVCRACAKNARLQRQKTSQRTRKVGGLPPGVSISVSGAMGDGAPPPQVVEALMHAVSDMVSGMGRAESRPKAAPEMHDFPCARAEEAYRIGEGIHLEGLHLIGELEAVHRSMRVLGMQLAGIAADGVRETGHVYRLRYTGSAARAARVMEDLLAQERNARVRLFEEMPRVFGDALCRALAILKNCRLLSPGELFDLLSPLRLAALENMLDGIDLGEIQALLASIDLSSNEEKETAQERDRLDAERADEMNRRFEDVVLNERAEEKFL
ncbi:MAG: hypothetical protein ACI4R9_01170 [Kiritimatiellia bacterium]